MTDNHSLPPPRSYRSEPDSADRQAPPARPRRGCLATVIALCVAALALGLLAVLTLVLVGLAGIVSGVGGDSGAYLEKEIEAGTGTRKVVIVSIHGIISSQPSLGIEATAGRIVEQLRQAAADENVVAVILDIDSPGGEVTATDEIHHEVQRLREERQIPVVACIRSMGASGGYYVAAGTDHIVANRLSITGSIGVIIAGYNVSKVLERWQVEPMVFKSGANKDILSMTRTPTEQEALIIQQLVDHTFAEFAQVVAKGRQLEVETVRGDPIGTGQILSGAQALELGLVDELGYLDDAIAAARNLAKAPEAGVYHYERHPSLLSIFSEAKAGDAERQVVVNIPPLSELPRLQQGQAYYLYLLGH